MLLCSGRRASSPRTRAKPRGFRLGEGYAGYAAAASSAAPRVAGEPFLVAAAPFLVAAPCFAATPFFLAIGGVWCSHSVWLPSYICYPATAALPASVRGAAGGAALGVGGLPSRRAQLEFRAQHRVSCALRSNFGFPRGLPDLQESSLTPAADT